MKKQSLSSLLKKGESIHFFEVVPRDIPQALHLIKCIYRDYPSIKGINIPDILRLKNRSISTSIAVLKQNLLPVIPHIRAIDCDIPTHLKKIEDFAEQGGEAVLIVSGDTSNMNIATETHNTRSVDLIQSIKKYLPHLYVFCALDSYRSSLKKELSYCTQKLDCGADGFFSQPFFDEKLSELFLTYLENTHLFMGCAPITTSNNLNYWKNINHVVFPPDFKIGLRESSMIIRKITKQCEYYKQHTYHMPIYTPYDAYLNEVFQNDLQK